MSKKNTLSDKELQDILEKIMEITGKKGVVVTPDMSIEDTKQAIRDAKGDTRTIN